MTTEMVHNYDVNIVSKQRDHLTIEPTCDEIRITPNFCGFPVEHNTGFVESDSI